MAAKTTTIRVRTETRERLRTLSDAAGVPAADLVERWAREADEDLLLAQAVEDWKALEGEDLKAYRQLTRELEAFDAELPSY